jgi:outer membrane biosynthesis protein TonB
LIIKRMQRSNAQWACVGIAPVLLALGCSSGRTPAHAPEASTSSNEASLEGAEPSPSDSEHAAQAATPAVPTRASRAQSGPVLPWLSPSHVAAAVRAQEPAFGACQTLGNSPSREGAVTVGWLVGPDGSVANVTLGKSTFTSELVNQCVLSVARQVAFPASASSAQVYWTVRLRGSEAGPIAEAGRYRNR